MGLLWFLGSTSFLKTNGLDGHATLDPNLLAQDMAPYFKSPTSHVLSNTEKSYYFLVLTIEDANCVKKLFSLDLVCLSLT